MEVRLTLKPGQRGTKKLVAKYGDRLICVRYRYDGARGKRYKTVELIEDVGEWAPSPGRRHPDRLVGIRLQWKEHDLRRAIEAGGGAWDAERRYWRLRYRLARRLKIENRVIESR